MDFMGLAERVNHGRLFELLCTCEQRKVQRKKNEKSADSVADLESITTLTTSDSLHCLFGCYVFYWGEGNEQLGISLADTSPTTGMASTISLSSATSALITVGSRTTDISIHIVFSYVPWESHDSHSHAVVVGIVNSHLYCASYNMCKDRWRIT